MPLISVIMPAYNRAALIPSAIESVLAQTLTDWELILINDASEDSTPEVMHSYASGDSRIRLIHNEVNSRRGPIEWEPRNDGLRIASGTFIAYLDADNTWRPRFLERLAGVLLDEPDRQLVYCDSCNHYSTEEAARVISRDSRNLVDSGPTWTVFSNDELDPKLLGFEQYVDTNEMMHRATTFVGLDNLWRTRHPNRDEINFHQAKQCPYRRHNDLDLVERVLQVYGPHSIKHIREVHIDFFYPSAKRSLLSARSNTAAGPIARKPDSAIHTQTACFMTDLNVGHFYESYLSEQASKGHSGPVAVKHDFGLGEIHGIDSVDLPELYRRFVASGGMEDLIVRYNGATRLADAYADVAEHYNRAIGTAIFDTRSIVPFDGCHNALENSISVLTGTSGWGGGRELIAYAVPSYPYWAIAASARRMTMPIEAYDADTFIAGLRELPGYQVGAVIVHSPGNPLGHSYSQEQFAQLGRLARERDWSIIVDATYNSFLEATTPLAPLLELPLERTVICDSVSKAWGMPGLRLGFGICFDINLAAALRANKSGQSLLPSSLKQKFFAHLLSEHPEIPQHIVTGVHARKQRARSLLLNSSLTAFGIEMSADWTVGPFELLFLDGLDRSEQTSESLADGLRYDFGVKLLPDSHFFPPLMQRRGSRTFLRLSVGCISDVERGTEALVEGLTMLLANKTVVERSDGS